MFEGKGKLLKPYSRNMGLPTHTWRISGGQYLPCTVEYEIYWRVISFEGPKKMFQMSPFFKIESF